MLLTGWSHWDIISLVSLFIDLEYPTLFPVHENPYVVSNNEAGGGIGYVESNQPFHDNIYSKSARVTPAPSVLTEIVVIIIIAGMSILEALVPLNPRPLQLLDVRQHIR